MLRYIYVTALILTMFSTFADAQIRSRRQIPSILRGLWANAKIGPTMYFGDLVDDGSTKFAFSLSADKEVLKWLNIRAELEYNMLGGKQDGGLFFKSTAMGVNVGGLVNVLNVSGYYNPSPLVPYVGLGGGILMVNYDKKPENEPSRPLNKYEMEYLYVKGSTMAPSVYGLLGAKYKINKHWGVSVEVKGVFPFSDMLDGHDKWWNPALVDISSESEGGTTVTPEVVEPVTPEVEVPVTPEVEGGEAVAMMKNALAVSSGCDVCPNGHPGKEHVGWVTGNNDFFYTIMFGCTYKFYDMNWRSSSKYNRKIYLRNKASYKRNVKRYRRR